MATILMYWLVVKNQQVLKLWVKNTSAVKLVWFLWSEKRNLPLGTNDFIKKKMLFTRTELVVKRFYNGNQLAFYITGYNFKYLT